MASKKRLGTKIKKVKILKVEQVAPDIHVIVSEFEVQGATELPMEPIPAEPIELGKEGKEIKSSWLQWLWKTLW